MRYRAHETNGLQKMRAMMSILCRAIRRESRAGSHRKVLKHLDDCTTDSYWNKCAKTNWRVAAD